MVNRKRSVNGERTLSLSFLLDDMNADFLDELSFNWKAVFDKDRYTLIDPSIEALLKKRSVTAVDEFFTDFGGHYLQDEVENESRTAYNAYTQLFEGTGYTPVLVDSFNANTLSYQKNQSKAERFHYFNERYKAEFVIRGKYVYLYHKVGTYKPHVRIDEDLNVKSAKVSFSTSGFFTWCKCFYDKKEDTDGAEEEYKNSVVYQNTAMIEKYGEIEGPAIYQGNIKSESVMLEFAQDSQANSYTVSHEVSLVDLREQGYEEFIFEPGDTVKLSLSSINQTIDIRIIEIDEQFDVHGNLMDMTLTLGNEDIVKAHKNNKDDVLMNLEDWLEGRKPIPMDILTPALQRASEIINGDSDSVMDYRKDRLIGWHSKNKGNNVQLNVSGLEFVRNGETKTAITYEGIVADAITTGTLRAITIDSVEVYASDFYGGRFTGGELFSTNNNTKFNLNTGHFHMENANFTLGGGADIHFEDVGNRLYYSRLDAEMNITRTAGMGVGRSINDRLPYVFMGTTGTGRSGFHPMDDKYFTGFIANTSRRIVDDGIGNSVVGNVFHVRDEAVAFSRGILFDLRGVRKTIMPMNTETYTYDLGADNNSFDRAYIQSMRSNDNLDIQNKFDTLQGYRLNTSYNNTNFISFVGLNAGPYWDNPRYYSLGTNNSPFSQIYLLNQPNVSSDERLKKNIADNMLGLDFIRDLHTITYQMAADMPDNGTKYGVSAQNVLSTLSKHSISEAEQSIVNKGDNGYYSVQYNQLIAPMMKGMQEHYTEFKTHKSDTQKEIEFLKEENVKLKNRLSKLEGVA